MCNLTRLTLLWTSAFSKILIFNIEILIGHFLTFLLHYVS